MQGLSSEYLQGAGMGSWDAILEALPGGGVHVP